MSYKKVEVKFVLIVGLYTSSATILEFDLVYVVLLSIDTFLSSKYNIWPMLAVNTFLDSSKL